LKSNFSIGFSGELTNFPDPEVGGSIHDDLSQQLSQKERFFGGFDQHVTVGHDEFAKNFGISPTEMVKND